MSVSEVEPIWLVRVAFDAEPTPVVHSVVFAANQQEIPGVSRTVMFPMDDVVYFEAVASSAIGDPTPATVALFDHGPSALRHDAL